MTAIDTDVLSLMLQGDAGIIARLRAIPRAQRFVPIVDVEEAVRGRLDVVRQAQASKGKLTLMEAYERLEVTLIDVRRFQILPYTSTADALFKAWRAAKIRIGTQDLRIAAIAFAHGAKLVTRNARDYTQVPDLNLEVWQ